MVKIEGIWVDAATYCCCCCRCGNFLPLKYPKLCYRMKHKLAGKKIVEIEPCGGRGSLKLRKNVGEWFFMLVAVNFWSSILLCLKGFLICYLF